MNTQKLAQTILERRRSASPIVTQGEMIGLIGSDGLQEALQRRWLVPQEDTGFLSVSADMLRVEEMRELSEKCDKCKCAECECEEKEDVNESREAVMAHAGFKAGVIIELLSPGTGHDPNASGAGGMPAPATSAPTGNPTSTGGGLDKPDIGSEVSVVENGRTYIGRVSAADNNRFKISFGGDRPPVEREYAENEMKVMQSQNA